MLEVKQHGKGVIWDLGSPYILKQTVNLVFAFY